MARQKPKEKRKRKRVFGKLPVSALAGNADQFVHREGPALVAKIAARRAELSLAPCAYVPL